MARDGVGRQGISDPDCSENALVDHLIPQLHPALNL